MSELLAHLAWRNPDWLWLALTPWLPWLLRALSGARTHSGYADPQLLAWARAQQPPSATQAWTQRLWRPTAIALAWLLFAMAMAGPRLPLSVYRQDQADYTQLMVVLDLSRSMTARDVAPNRLQRARLELHNLIAHTRRLKIGLVVYAGEPHLLLPPTDDPKLLQHALQLAHYGLMPSAGSNLAGALAFAARQFTASQAAHAVLLVSDGGLPQNSATLEQQLDDTATALAQQGIHLYALGVGSRDGAPLQRHDGHWLSYHGKPVIARLHRQRLQRITRIGNGRYAQVSDRDDDWRPLYDNAIRYLDSGSGAQRDAGLVEWRELYRWCLIPAMALLLLGYLAPRRQHVTATTALLPVALLAIALSVPLAPATAQAAAQDWAQQAFDAYARQDWPAAQQAYARVPGFAGRIGEGSSAYRQGDFATAARLYIQAVLDANSDAQRAQAIFNLANSRYRQHAYAEAADLYRQVLRYAPRDSAANTNLALVRAILSQQPTAQNDRAARQGKGTRSVRAPANQIPKGRLSIDQQSPQPAATASTPGSEQTGQGQGQALRDARPLVQKLVEFRHPDWHYAHTTPARILLKAEALKSNQRLLWQRIFIGQEGLPPAPLAQPLQRPGVRPW